MNDVNNVIYNNFECHDQLPKAHRFLSRSLWSPAILQKIQPFCTKKKHFWLTLEDSREKTVHFQEFTMLKVVVNNIVDIIHFDQNILKWNIMKDH